MEIVRAKRGGEPGPDNIVQTHFGCDRIADRLHETLRVLDLPNHVVFDHDVLFVAREELGRPWIVDAQPAVEEDGGLEEPLRVQACFGDGTDGAAELRDQY